MPTAKYHEITTRAHDLQLTRPTADFLPLRNALEGARVPPFHSTAPVGWHSARGGSPDFARQPELVARVRVSRVFDQCLEEALAVRRKITPGVPNDPHPSSKRLCALHEATASHARPVQRVHRGG